MAADDEIGRLPNLTLWLRADAPAAMTAGGTPDAVSAWRSADARHEAVPKFPAYPPVQHDGIGTRRSVYFGTGTSAQNGQLVLPARIETYPAGKDYTIAILFKSTTTTRGVLVGSGDDGGTTNAVIELNLDGTLRVAHSHTRFLLSPIGTSYADGKPHLAVVSYDFAAKQAVLRVDGVQKAVSNDVAQEVADTADNTRMVIGGIGKSASLSGGLINTDIADVIVFSGLALHKPDYSDQLATLEKLRTLSGTT